MLVSLLSSCSKYLFYFDTILKLLTFFQICYFLFISDISLTILAFCNISPIYFRFCLVSLFSSTTFYLEIEIVFFDKVLCSLIYCLFCSRERDSLSYFYNFYISSSWCLCLACIIWSALFSAIFLNLFAFSSSAWRCFSLFSKIQAFYSTSLN